MLEAFVYAKANVELWYEEQDRLASEHSGLDDNGDALFSLDPAIDIADGRLAEIAYIDSLIEEGEKLSRVLGEERKDSPRARQRAAGK